MLDARRQVGTAIGVVIAPLAVLGVGSTFLLTPLNGNLRYEAGVKEVGLASAAGTFSHRPLAFRLLTDGIFRVAEAATTSTVGFELVVRLLVLVLAVGAGILLWHGLSGRDVSDPALHAAVVVGALVLLGPISAGEPEWLAIVLATAGVGLALLGRRRPWLWAMLAAVAFVAAAGMKIISLPIACLGLAAVAASTGARRSEPSEPASAWVCCTSPAPWSGCPGRSSGSSTSARCRTVPVTP